jgi:thioredoxin-related protein
MRPHRFPLPALLLALALPCLSGPASAEKPVPRALMGEISPGAQKLDWLAFDAAATLAGKEGKHVIVDVYTTWCGWCKVMERQTYGDSEVAEYLARNFVLAKVNGESSAKIHWQGREMTERQFARETRVTGFPTTFFLKPDLEMLGGVPGFIRPHDFMLYARYVGTRWYEKGKIQDFIKEEQAKGQPAN